MRRTLLAALALCAASSLHAQPRRVLIALPAYQHSILLDTISVAYTIDVPRGELYGATVKALDQLGVPVTMRDSVIGQTGNLRFVKMRKLAGESMSKYLNCGDGLVGPNADNFQITSALLASVDSTTGHSQLRISFIGSGQDITGNAKDPVACASTGLLESRIATVAKAKLGM